MISKSLISCIPAAALVCHFLTSTPASASTILINFSSATGNNASVGNTGAAGPVDVVSNVGVQVGLPNSISVSGITGTSLPGSWYQQNQLARLGQPYATLLGGATLSGINAGLSSTIELDLSTYLTADSYGSYEVTLYYASRTANSDTFVTASIYADNEGTFVGGTLLSGPGALTITNTDIDSGYWGGHSGTVTISASNPHIWINTPSNSTGNDASGLAAIKITGIPEPSAALLGGLGTLLLIRRRRD